jgi:hypothetical protein
MAVFFGTALLADVFFVDFLDVVPDRDEGFLPGLMGAGR